MLQQGRCLYGVRFGSETNYCVLDIDSHSFYHPDQDPFAIPGILTALESLGLTSYMACTSSYSGGLHLYFPFQPRLKTWMVALVVSRCLEDAGFSLTPGQLEVFPNPRSYRVHGKPSLYHAHRLPLQPGSYLLNQDFQPVWGDAQRFVEQWKFCQQRNELDAEHLQKRCQQLTARFQRVSVKAAKFLQDLTSEIEMGWTSHGQTNRLLGRIALYCYVFHHVVYGGQPLEGQDLVEKMVAVATALPGYQDWCRHQHEIAERAAEWASCVEASRYFPYGYSSGQDQKKPGTDRSKPDSKSWNQQQMDLTRDKIRRAIATLLERDQWPAQTTARFHALVQFGIGGGSLYRHRDLWHPQHLVEGPAEIGPVENPPDPPTSKQEMAVEGDQGASTAIYPASLFPGNGRNATNDGDLRDRLGGDRTLEGRNSFPPQLPGPEPGPESGESDRIAPPRHESRSEAYVQRMQQYLASNDPILMAEALAWASENPGVLEPEYPGSPHDLLRHSVNLALQPAADFSDILAAIAVRIRQLRWTADQVGDRLFALVGKRSQAMLEDEELWQWAEHLDREVIAAGLIEVNGIRKQSFNLSQEIDIKAYYVSTNSIHPAGIPIHCPSVNASSDRRSL